MLYESFSLCLLREDFKKVEQNFIPRINPASLENNLYSFKTTDTTTTNNNNNPFFMCKTRSVCPCFNEAITNCP